MIETLLPYATYHLLSVEEVNSPANARRKYRACWHCGSTLRPVIGKCLVQISAMTPAILIENFHCFSQSLQAHAAILPRLGHDHFHTCRFQLIYPTIRCCFSISAECHKTNHKETKKNT
jgi:hypothetical protein